MTETEDMWDVPQKQTPMSGPVLYYTDAVIDHFTHPRHCGSLEPGEISGTAVIGDPGCGDQMRLEISLRAGRIDKIAFKSFGCPGAIATSSMLCELACGRTVEEAQAISDDDVIQALGGIPENKKHCSLLGVKALQAAISDFRTRSAKPGETQA